jgi:catechol 2,3-dioxygenase-like lactoylglutathione lyase family enzyme
MLQHVALEVRESELESCSAFWALLGFVAVEVPESLRGTTSWLERGRTQVHLLLTEDPVAPPRGHCAVVCEDYAATLARLERSGFFCEARREHWGAPRCFVRDPAGHRIELMAAPPARTAARS